MPRGRRQLFKALYDAGEAGLSYNELVKVMGWRNRKVLIGVLGALGKRVNGTPGYGQRKQPGSAMMLAWDTAPDGDYQVRLRAEARQALEQLKPAWL